MMLDSCYELRVASFGLRVAGYEVRVKEHSAITDS